MDGDGYVHHPTLGRGVVLGWRWDDDRDDEPADYLYVTWDDDDTAEHEGWYAVELLKVETEEANRG